MISNKTHKTDHEIDRSVKDRLRKKADNHGSHVNNKADSNVMTHLQEKLVSNVSRKVVHLGTARPRMMDSRDATADLVIDLEEDHSKLVVDREMHPV